MKGYDYAFFNKFTMIKYSYTEKLSFTIYYILLPKALGI